MFNINNRRYLGSKSKLLAFIEKVITQNCKNCSSFLDLFGGTGIVGFHFNSKYKILINDILNSNVVVYKSFFLNKRINKQKLQKDIHEFNKLDVSEMQDNYYSLNFADTYLSKKNMKKVGVIRDKIDKGSLNGTYNARESAILLTSLIYAIDKIANTVGHYDAYRKGGDLEKELILEFPNIDDTDNKNNVVYHEDANKLVKSVRSDIVYIDPPYNSRQYCDAYHFLENVVTNQKPEVFGTARKMDRTNLKSLYCSCKATIQFRELIQDIRAKYIIVSYNNTGDKINSRSNAKISDKEIIEILKQKGKVSIYETEFNAFTTGKSHIEGHKERLFLCEVGKKQENSPIKLDHSDEIVKSPLNYTGGKGKLYSQIKNYFPKNITNFYDVFCGGTNVGVNVKADNVICIDNNKQLITLLEYIKNSNYEVLVNNIEKKIKDFNLSNSYKNGYEYYQCNSANGLGKFNKEGFTKLKNEYNKTKDTLLFLILIFFGFNNQIRFNSKGEFNLPVGKRDFNKNLRKKLRCFIDKLQAKNIQFACKDFRDINISQISSCKDFLYLDPPYFLGTATYNENGGWTENDEKDLLSFLESCNKRNIKFALSNVLCHKGKIHNLLISWIETNKFKIHYLNYNYKNSNYHSKNQNEDTKEVLITNY